VSGGDAKVPQWWWEVMGSDEMVVWMLGCDGEKRKGWGELYGTVEK
jgi:hypothetical protein